MFLLKTSVVQNVIGGFVGRTVLCIRRGNLWMQTKEEYFPQYGAPSGGGTMTGGNGNGIKPDGTNFFDICCCSTNTPLYDSTRDPPYKRTVTNGQAKIAQATELSTFIAVTELH